MAPDKEVSAPDKESSAPDKESSAPDKESSAPDSGLGVPDTKSVAPDKKLAVPDTRGGEASSRGSCQPHNIEESTMSINKVSIPDNTTENMSAMMEKWAPVAERAEPSSPRTPIPVLVGEALDLYYAIMVNWEPRAGLPGMKEALAGNLIEEATPKEIVELSFAVSHAQGL